MTWKIFIMLVWCSFSAQFDVANHIITRLVDGDSIRHAIMGSPLFSMYAWHGEILGEGYKFAITGLVWDFLIFRSIWIAAKIKSVSNPKILDDGRP